jgi:carbon storage regulator
MLILRRKKNESILIGNSIRITVIESASDGVRLAIDAPKQISILREELSIAEQENKSAIAPKAENIANLQGGLKHLIKKAELKKNAPVAVEEKKETEPVAVNVEEKATSAPTEESKKAAVEAEKKVTETAAAEKKENAPAAEATEEAK